MDSEEFRAAGHALIDWIADERARVRERHVLPGVVPGQVRALLASVPPTEVVGIEAMLAELDRVVVPNMTMVQHPMHFGWFPSNASLASVLGDLASSGLGGLGISWESNPALTEVEEVVVDWLRQLCGLSEQWRGTIHDTASASVLVALLCARERASGYCGAGEGLQSCPSPLVVYTTAQAHSSVTKAVSLAGFGLANLRVVPTDASFAMDPEELHVLIDADLAAGRIPAAVIASVGSTGTTAFDPVGAIVDVAAPHGMWVHVDAAMAGTAMLLPECRHLWDGVEGVDSVVWNPHKWMGTVLDTSLFFVRGASNVEHLVRVMSTNPSYLRSTATETEATQYRDWGIPLGRRFRALKLWFHLSLDGVESIRERVRRDLDNAQWLAAQFAQRPGWEVLAPVALQTVCVRHVPVDSSGATLTGDALDAHTLAWLRRINRSGKAFLSPSQLEGRWMVRVSIGVASTERGDVEALFALMCEAAENPAT